jgi:exopolysaccharide production protein ExoZ
MQFLARRVVRIVPLYWIATTAMVLLLAPFASTKAVIASFMFWPYAAGGAPVLNVGWTLNIEMFFYLIFAVALLAKRRIVVAATASTFLVAFSWLAPTTGAMAFFANPIIIEFVFGMWIALAYRANIRLPLWATIGTLAAGLVLFATVSPDVVMSNSNVPRQFSWGISAALIVAALALSSRARQDSTMTNAVVFLGNISYALYLIHNITLSLLGQAANGIIADHVWFYSTAMLATCLIVGLSGKEGLSARLKIGRTNSL